MGEKAAARPARETMLVFGRPQIGEEEIAEVVECLRGGWIGTGPRVARLERDFERFKGGGYAVAVGSCTAALHVSMLVADLRPGDEVIVLAMTFCATVNAVIHSGAVPVLADVAPDTMNLDPGEVLRRITPRTRAVIPVHFAGRPCDMGRLGEIATRHGLAMIEDCAHAVEAMYGGRPAGTFGDFGCFSFYVTKNVVAGEGGMVWARSEAAADRLKILALHGMSHDAWRRFGDRGYRHYEVVDAGFKYNMTDVQAALATHQLATVEENHRRRRAIWQRYDEAFADLPLTRTSPVLGGPDSATRCICTRCSSPPTAAGSPATISLTG